MFSKKIETTDFHQAFNLGIIPDVWKMMSNLTQIYLSDTSRRGIKLFAPKDLLQKAKQLTDSRTMPSDHSVTERLKQIIDLHFETSVSLHSRGYMARQFSSVPPVAALYDFLLSMVPQPGTFYECGSLANVADKIIAEKFGKFLNWPAHSFDMVSTSGGSLANMTGILAARNIKFPQSWDEGLNHIQDGHPAIAIGEDAHFSVDRIAGILGLGHKFILRLAVDKKRRICLQKAKETLKKAKSEGLNVFCIVASAGTTSTGAIDPLKALAELAHNYNAWLHVDAAHGGALLVSDLLRTRVQELRYADSFCLDTHKMLFLPAPCTLLFYRNKDYAYSPFPVQASYVLDEEGQGIREFESGIKNFECTKRPGIINLWVTWCLYGQEFFAEKLNHLVSFTQKVYSRLSLLNQFHIINEPEINILCFRYQPKDLSVKTLSLLQKKIWAELRHNNEFFISKVDLDNITALRVVFMNHNIAIEDVDDLFETISIIGEKILQDFKSQKYA